MPSTKGDFPLNSQLIRALGCFNDKIFLQVIPSLKLRCSPLKMDGWKMEFPLGARPIFRCQLLVSGSVYHLAVICSTYFFFNEPVSILLAPPHKKCICIFRLFPLCFPTCFSLEPQLASANSSSKSMLQPRL